LKHPLPPSENRHEHEKCLRKVLSCKINFQGIAAITLGDAWSLEEVFIRNGDSVLGEKNGSSPIHIAIQLASIDCLLVLINIGVDLNKPNCFGFTPLYLARASSLSTIEEMLISNGAKLKANTDNEKNFHSSILDIELKKIESPKACINNNISKYNKLPSSHDNF
jgi:ankyrin repeat protein